MLRNGWPKSSEIAGRNAAKRPAVLVRKTQIPSIAHTVLFSIRHSKFVKTVSPHLIGRFFTRVRDFAPIFAPFFLDYDLAHKNGDRLPADLYSPLFIPP
jgi:hypothetical protein